MPLSPKEVKSEIENLHTKRISLQCAKESVILLKNDGVLPISDKVKKIAIIGYHAGTIRAMFGGYTSMSLFESSLVGDVTMAGVKKSDIFPTTKDEDNIKETHMGSIVQKEDIHIEEKVKFRFPEMKTLFEELNLNHQDIEFGFSKGYSYVGNDFFFT